MKFIALALPALIAALPRPRMSHTEEGALYAGTIAAGVGLGLTGLSLAATGRGGTAAQKLIAGSQLTAGLGLGSAAAGAGIGAMVDISDTAKAISALPVAHTQTLETRKPPMEDS
jgi:hypothetical protein